MNNQGRVGPIVSDGQITSEQRMSRIRTLRIFGGLHIGLGVICFLLGVAGASLSTEDKNKECDNNYYGNSFGSYVYYRCKNEKSRSEASFNMFIVSAIFSGWFILTGLIPFCMTLNRESSWKCLKTAFLVCSIISAAVFGFTVFILAVVLGIINGADGHTDVKNVSSGLAFFGFVEFIAAIASASFGCCCSQLYTSQQPVAIFMTGAHYGMQQSQMQSGYQQPYAPNWTAHAPQTIQQHQAPYFPHTGPNVPLQQPIPQQYQAPSIPL